jgi:hypothetical protein
MVLVIALMCSGVGGRLLSGLRIAVLALPTRDFFEIGFFEVGFFVVAFLVVDFFDVDFVVFLLVDFLLAILFSLLAPISGIARLEPRLVFSNTMRYYLVTIQHLTF